MNNIYNKNANNRVIYRNQQPQTKNNLNLNLPSLPLLGQISPNELSKHLLMIIEDEATAVEFYTRLLQMAPNTLHKEFVEEARNEEQKHLTTFTKVYEFLFEHSPAYTITPVQFSNYKEGLLMALKDELEAADHYKEMMLKTNDPMVKDAFFYAMGDELEHAIRFSTLHHII